MRTSILVVLMAPLACQAGAYKCTQPDGSIVFQQTECAATSDQTTMNLMPAPVPSGPGYEPPDDLDYSVEGQLRRMEESKALERAERKDRRKELEAQRSREEQQRLSDGRAADAARKSQGKCTYYQSAIEEREHKLRRGYKDRSDRLYDRKMLRYFEMKAAQYCE